MRASRSWPRSSVPSGCCHDGPTRRALKSISLIATLQANGPSRMASTIAANIAPLTSAMRCRRKRRQASRPGETYRRRMRTAPPVSAEGDARVEPAIKDIGDQVEEDDEAGEHERHGHHDWGVIGEDRADQERADPGDAKDLLGDDRAAEN